ncbi:hypothetical protein [Streptomyces narbonensis]
MNYTELMEVDLGKLGTAAAGWKHMAEKMQRLGGEARDGMKAKADKARWDGVNANATRDFVGKTVKEFKDLHEEAQSIFSVLDDALTELKGLQQQARSVTAEAKEKGFSVTGHKDGSIAIADALICEVDGPGQKKRDTMQWYADRLAGIMSHATEVDAAAVRALRASHGGDPADAGHTSYTSLDEDMLPRAMKLAGLGEDADDKQRGELGRLWQSLSPEARAQLWMRHKDGLLAADLLTPSVKRVAADDGAGPFDVDSPGFGDYWMELQANGDVEQRRLPRQDGRGPAHGSLPERDRQVSRPRR